MSEELYDEDGRLKKELRAFDVHGVSFSRVQGSSQAVGHCPFCGQEKFYVKLGDTLWDCKSKDCIGHRQGNLFTFLKQVTEFHNEDTAETDWKRIAANRKFHSREMRNAGLGFTGEKWLIPVKNAKGTVVDVRLWKEGGKLISTSGCKMGLFGMDLLAKVQGKKRRVWLCEGEWDALALRTALKKAGFDLDIVVAVPGAGTFKPDWVNFFRGHDVWVPYDADEAGDTGMVKVHKALKKVAASMRFIHWPETMPSGFDTRDFFGAPDATFKKFEKLFQPLPRRSDTSKIPTVNSAEAELEEIEDKPWKTRTWEELKKVFAKHYQMTDELYGALKLACAVTVTTWLQGDPVWAFIVSPPGNLKSEILMAFSSSPHTVCKSSISPKALCSGWKGTEGEDPSLLPKLHGRTFILKDYTEVTAMHTSAQEEILSVLRGAFDGEVTRSFGNGQERSYKTHFHILAGVTPTIFGNNKAALGERFLKYVVQKGVGFDASEAIRAALSNVGHEDSMREEVREAVRSFIATLHERFKKGKLKILEMTELVKERLVSLAQLISMLRAQVERDFRAEKLLYRPQHEVGTRIAKQLKKIATGFAFVSGRDHLTEEDERIIHKLALDTAHGFNVDIFDAIVKGRKKGIERRDLSEQLGIPGSTLDERLENMLLLGLLDKRKFDPAKDESDKRKVGAPAHLWFPTPRALSLWKGMNAGRETK